MENKEQFAEDLKIRHAHIFTKCPHCNMKGVITNDINKIYYSKGIDEDRCIEVANVNGFCSMCGDTFRISSGNVIKRAKNIVELSSQTVFYLGCISMIIGMSSLFAYAEYSKRYGDTPQIKNIWLIVFLSLTLLSIISIIISHFFPNVKLFPRDKVRNIDRLLGFEIQTLKDKKEDKNYNNMLYTVNLESQQKIIEQKREIFELKPILKIEDRTPFACEKDLQNHLAQVTSKLYFNGKILQLYQGRKGVEFDTREVGRIDLLFIDLEKNFYIIETKLDRIPDKTIGQISRYMGWVDKNLNNSKKNVYGLIIGFNHNEKLKYAAIPHEKIYLFEYSMGLTFKQIIN